MKTYLLYKLKFLLLAVFIEILGNLSLCVIGNIVTMESML